MQRIGNLAHNIWQPPEYDTTDQMQRIDGVWIKVATKSGTITVQNNGQSGAIVEIKASADGVNFPIVLSAEQTISAAGSAVVSFSDYYHSIEIYARSETQGVSTKVLASGSAIAV